jgi:hypothetical protein
MQYPNSGSLSVNKFKKEGDKSPNLNGSIIMERSALKQLLDEQGDEITIKLSAWTMPDSGRGKWLRLSWNNYKSDKTSSPKSQDDSQDIPF